MPFYRRRSFGRRRFSATPRRSFGFRRRGVGTQEGKLQKAQLFEQLTLITDQSSIVTPGFLHILLTPWDNGPPGGFDRSWEIKGIIWQMSMQFTGFLDGQGLHDEFLPASTFNVDQTQLPVASNLWVDAAEADGSPRSNLSYNPFLTTPPIIPPGAGFDDDETFPTRVLAGKVGAISAGTVAQAGGGGLLNPTWSWSGRVSRRVSVANRQGLYLSAYAGTPLEVLPDIDELRVRWQVWCKYFYRLSR